MKVQFNIDFLLWLLNKVKGDDKNTNLGFGTGLAVGTIIGFAIGANYMREHKKELPEATAKPSKSTKTATTYGPQSNASIGNNNTNSTGETHTSNTTPSPH